MGPSRKPPTLIKLVRLGLNRFASDEAYSELQAALAEATLLQLEERGVNLTGSRVLEIPAGRGGYAMRFALHGSNTFAADLYASDVFRSELRDVPFVRMDATVSFPFEDGVFDFVHCASLVEHLVDPRNLLDECFRILADDGRMLLSFPPFWSLSMIGGHQFKPYHFLGERFAVRRVSRKSGKIVNSYAHDYAGEGGLYVRTIAGIKRMLLASGFEVENLYTRLLDLPTARLPGLLADLCTWHACFLVKKASPRS